MLKLLGVYKNGNYTVKILNDGTKIRETEDDEFIPSFAENCDVKITDKCDGGCEYCLIEGTKILMGDFTYKNIEDVNVGDEIIGFEENSIGNGKLRKIIKSKVTQTFKHVESELIDVKTESGLSIAATPNHPFLCEGYGKNHSRIFNKIENIGVEEYLFSIGLPYELNINYNSDDYKLGYIIGAWCGDGTRCHNVDKNGYDMYLCRFVTKDDEINERVMEFTSYFIDEFYYNKFDMCEKISEKAVTNATCDVYNKLNKLIDNNFGKIDTVEYSAGFCAGIFDSEGHIGSQRKTIRISNTNKNYIDEIIRCLDILKLEYCVENYKDITKYSKDYNPIYNVRIKGKHQWNNFLWITRPACIRKSLEYNIMDSLSYSKDKIISKNKYNKMQYVYNLETECHTYIANNYLVHNCYEGCTPNGRHGDILNYKFLDTLHPYTELAINGNDLSHPDLIPFLKKMRDKNIIVNMTVNQIHFEKHYDLIEKLIYDKLIYGLGVSLRKPTVEFINLVSNFSNAVIHVINGIFTYNDYKILKDNDLKILILGYKQLRRGVDYYDNHMKTVCGNKTWLYNELEEMLKHFKVVSFDNLAIKQLDVKRLLSEEKWEEFYMGDDSEFTFFIDMVEGKFGKNSLASENERFDILDNIDEMFERIRLKR